MHFMPNNNLEENISHFILIAPTKKICLQKLHFKFLELKNCIWGTRFQVPESFAALAYSVTCKYNKRNQYLTRWKNLHFKTNKVSNDRGFQQRIQQTRTWVTPPQFSSVPRIADLVHLTGECELSQPEFDPWHWREVFLPLTTSLWLHLLQFRVMLCVGSLNNRDNTLII